MRQKSKFASIAVALSKKITPHFTPLISKVQDFPIIIFLWVHTLSLTNKRRVKTMEKNNQKNNKQNNKNNQKNQKNSDQRNNAEKNEY